MIINCFRKSEARFPFYIKLQSRLTIIMVIPFAIGVVYSKERSGKSGSLAKCHKQRLVDLPLGIDEDAAKEQN